MKRTLLLILAAFLSCAALSAQDKIYFIDSRVVDALVDEVGEDMVYYRAFANQYGPTYSASVYSISKIVYQNGYVQDFGLTAVSPLLAGTAGTMRYANGKLYLGSHTSFGEMHAEQIAFNLYGDQYFKGRRRITTGSTLMWVCGTSLVAGIIGFASYGEPQGCGLLTGIGIAGLGAGIPIYCSGRKMIKGIADDYNAKKGATLTVGPCRSGVGLALNF